MCVCVCVCVCFTRSDLSFYTAGGKKCNVDPPESSDALIVYDTRALSMM